MFNKDKEKNETSAQTQPSPIVNALLIGFLIGIIVYSVIVSTWGILTLIPLFFIYKLVTSKSKRD